MKSMVKGGIWKNSEDEILKAAVMKYGLNHWSRIASLLVQKTPAQCKSRWYEWLDPSVRKTEWSREEDEKLLHLAKIFPTQWRTVAPIVGRTAHQCQERYDKLLDEAQGRAEVDDEHDPRRLRPGEIDPNPEARPAKADAVDMDDDEKQMLQEARARLANVKGKKAKRKAREKVLDETRRISQLQKDRELRAAGLSGSSVRLKRGEIDYNREIPFEVVPAMGVHEIGPEENPKPNRSIKNVSVDALEGRTRDAEEKRYRKEDKRIIKKLKERDTAESVALKAEMEMAMYRSVSALALPEIESEESEEEESEDENNNLFAAKRIKASRLLHQLPEVENEVEIEAPDVDDLNWEDEEGVESDRGEIKISGSEVEQKLFRTSQVVARNLPRPKISAFDIQDEIQAEALALLVADALEHPVKGSRLSASQAKIKADRSKFSLAELKRAKASVESTLVDSTDAIVLKDVEVDMEKIKKEATELASQHAALKTQVESMLGNEERRILDIDDQLCSVKTEIEKLRRHKRVMLLCRAQEDANFSSQISDLTDKIKSKKQKNKELQDKYLRLSSFIKSFRV